MKKPLSQESVLTASVGTENPEESAAEVDSEKKTKEASMMS